MNNPFKSNGEMLPVASINSVFVDDVKAIDLFRPSLILSDVLQLRDELGLMHSSSSESLSVLFQELLTHDLDTVKEKANDIAVMYGYRLAKVLATLFNPSLQSISNRTNWSKEHWDYWRSIQHLYLVGGVTSPRLTKIFYQCIIDEFQKQQIEGVSMSFLDGSQNLGTRGMASIVDDGEYLIFDFGQTSIKRAHHRKHQGTIVFDTVLDPCESEYLFYKSSTTQEVKQTAVSLDDYIVSVITNTALETNFTGDTIMMSIANYVSNGTIYSARGGYGKLAYVAPNYQVHLELRLRASLKRKIHVRLFHDTSAMALLFQGQARAAVISLGTAFGVAFPDET